MAIYAMQNPFALRLKVFANNGQVDTRTFYIAYGNFFVHQWFIMANEGIHIMKQDAIWIVKCSFIE
jgi:hypothetical protein